MAIYTFTIADLTLRIVGRGWGQKGCVDFILPGDPYEAVVLAAKQWAVIAILAEAAKNAPDDSIQAFISSQELATRLKERGVVRHVNTENAVSTVSRLRKRLEKLKIAKDYNAFSHSDPATNFANRLIARTELGYRINLHPDNLKLDIGD